MKKLFQSSNITTRTILFSVLMLGTSLHAETVGDFVDYAHSYAAEYEVALSDEAISVIAEGVEASLEEINASVAGPEETRAAIRLLVDELNAGALDENPSEEVSQIRLVLALVSICPVWPLCE